MPGFTPSDGGTFGGAAAPPAPPAAPTPKVISTSLGTIFARVPSVTVEFAKSLLGPWTEQANLYLDRLRVCAAPEIDQATLTWHYGQVMQPGATTFAAVAPLNRNGDFIRVRIENWWDADYGTNNRGDWNANTNSPNLSSGGSEGDKYTVSVAGTTTIGGISDWEVGDVLVFKNGDWIRVTAQDWYGIVETATLHPDGNSSGTSTGTQRLTCYGLLRLAERKTIATTFVENSVADDVIEINRGLKFNEDERGEIRGHGNRSKTKQAIPDQPLPSLPGAKAIESYVFSWKERGQDEWSAEEAVEYLLCAHGRDITPDVRWRLYVDSGNLQWNPKGGLATDRRNLKVLLDDLISRHRGVGYEVHFNADKEEVVCRVFSFSDVDISMPNGETFDANPEQYSLDFEAALDVSVSELNDTITTKYHRVVIEGDWMTSTATLLVNTHLLGDWTDADETAYYKGASTEIWYAALDRKKKNSINRTTRNEDRLRNVFSRFRVDDDWTLTVDSLDGLFTDIRVFPQIDRYNGAGLVSTTEDWSIWIPGLSVTDKLPLRERYDYSDAHIPDDDWEATSTATELTPFLEPFAILNTQLARGDTWELLDKFNSDVADQPQKRKWYVNTRTHNDRPAVMLNVLGGPQHFIAKTAFRNSANADYDADDDPTKNQGIDYDDIAVTLTFEFSERARIERVINIPAAGELERVLRVHVEDCRLDYVVPNTVVGVKSGVPLYSDGGFVRDDRRRLDTLCKAASVWYGKERQTIELSYKQVRPIVELGWLIVNVGSTYQKTGVNSVVTSITYDIHNKSTTFQTHFAELDIL